MKNIQLILDHIYNDKLKDHELGDVIRTIYETLSDGFYEDPPNEQQEQILKELLVMSQKVDRFSKGDL